jgi:hypothetical protein
MMKLAAAVLLLVGTAAPAQDGEWIQLFNGKDLTGWTPKFTGHPLGTNFNDTYRVENGVLRVCYDKYEKFDERFGHLFYKEPFSHYVLRVEYRFVGEQCPGGPGWAWRNSGAMLHGQDPATMALDQKFPVSIEVQLLGGKPEGKRSTANLCTPGTNVVMKEELITRHCTESASKTFPGDQWVTVEVEVHGSGVIRHLIDGETVMAYEKPQLDPKDGDAKKLIRGETLLIEGGTISLQAESHPCEFRKVELKKLKP